MHAPVIVEAVTQSEQQYMLPSIFTLSTITPILPTQPILPITFPTTIPTISTTPLPPTNSFQQSPLTILQSESSNNDIIPNPFLQYTYVRNQGKQLCCYSPKRIRFDTTNIIIPHP